MKNSKIKKILLLVCVCVFGLIFTGCSEAITAEVKVTSSKKGTLTLGVGMDDELLEAYATMNSMTTDELISELKSSGMKYSKETMNGINYHMFSATEKNLTFSEIEEYLESDGFSDACLTKNYFYTAFDPESLNDSETSALGKAITQAAQIAANDDYSASDISYFVKVSVSFKSKIKSTNGKLSNASKKVTWTAKDSGGKQSFYASTTKAKKTAKVTSVKKNKKYGVGQKIKVKNNKSAAKMTLDGREIHSNYKVTEKGKHELILWSRNGKVQKITFTIK